jgi:hypothetical protein
MAHHYRIVTAHRDYRIWWWMNLVDFVLWLGPATAVLGAVGMGWLFGRVGKGSYKSLAETAKRPSTGGLWLQASAPAAEAAYPSRFRPMSSEVSLAGMAAVFWLTLLALNFSGTTRGEIGRLWIFLMPFPMLFSLALPWSYRQRLVVFGLMALASWFVGYVIPPFQCC